MLFSVGCLNLSRSFWILLLSSRVFTIPPNFVLSADLIDISCTSSSKCLIKMSESSRLRTEPCDSPLLASPSLRNSYWTLWVQLYNQLCICLTVVLSSPHLVSLLIRISWGILSKDLLKSRCICLQHSYPLPRRLPNQKMIVWQDLFLTNLWLQVINALFSRCLQSDCFITSYRIFLGIDVRLTRV